MLSEFKKSAKSIAKQILWKPPRSLHAGSESYIARPRRIDGPQFIQLGNRTTVDRFSWLSALDFYAGHRHTPRIILGDDVHLGRYACVTSIQSIVIEEGCLLSEHVYISDLSHGMSPEKGLLVEQPLQSKGPVLIGAHSFIGYRACVLPGVTLGKHCIVGANSVVTRSFPDYSLIGGCPARLLKIFSPERNEWISVPTDAPHDQ